MTIILDPTNERVPVERQPTQRPEVISGSIALLDISKPRGSVLLDQLEMRLNSRLPNIQVNRYSKPTFAKPAPDDLRREIRANNSFVIEGLAD